MIRLTLDVYLGNIGVTRYKLAQMTGIGFQTIDKYYKNKVVRYDNDVLDRICNALQCDVSDIISHTKD